MGKINTPVIEQAEAHKPHNTEGIITYDESFVTPSTPEDDSTDLVSLKMFFGMDVEDQSQDETLKEIFKWAKDKGIETRDELQSEIRKIESKIGIGLYNGNRAKQIKDYIVISSQFNEAKKKLGIMKGNLW